jgi:transglutaminase-like putative cysteine protease
MRFSAIHKVSSYLMCAAAFLALALSRELATPLVVGTALLGAASFFVEPGRWPTTTQQRWTTLWNIATIAVFALAVLQALRGELLIAGVRLICFLLINKLFNRRASRDYQHAYVLSFLMLVAGAALSADLSYAACFLFYVVFCTWTLTLFHLRREMEDNYLLKHSDDAQSERVEVERILNSRRIVGGSFLFGTGLVSLGIFLVSAIGFFLIPRFGFGFFANHGRRQQATIGFSDRVELGEYGIIKDNPQVVLRVELPAGPPAEPLRFRGVAFDHYQGGHWTRTAAAPPTQVVRRGSFTFLDPPSPRIDAETRTRILSGALEQNIYLDPLDTAVLFGASKPVAFALPPAGLGESVELEGRRADEVYAVDRHIDVRGQLVFSERKSGMRYTVYSRLGSPDLGRMLEDPSYTGAEAPPELHAYLGLPTMPQRVLELARALVAGQRTKFAAAVMVEQYLQNQLRYTLDLKRDERYEPIEDFLFVQKAGHCEYFASAMAVLLRAVGIPTRVVNGFLGGEWNQYGKYLAVRQGDAHAWVEVWLGQAGWVTFDPTPLAPSVAPTSAFTTRVRQLLDTIELAWFKYVIEYDLNKQVELAMGARRALSSSGQVGHWASWARRGATPLVGLLTCIALGWQLWRLRKVRGPNRRTTDLLLGRALDALERRGLPRAVGETSRELGRRAVTAGDPGAGAFVELVERCYEVRYGEVPVPRTQLEQLLDRVVQPPP